MNILCVLAFWLIHLNPVASQDPAGKVFTPGDRVVLIGESIDLPCKRSTNEGHVIWDTINVDNVIVEQIYDSETDAILEPYYAFVSGDPLVQNDFTLRVTVNDRDEVAIFTRCTVEQAGLDTVTETAMIFLIANDNPFGCSPSFFFRAEYDVGTMVYLGDCSGSAAVSHASGLGFNDYETIRFWAVDDEIHVPSKTLSVPSEYTAVANSFTDGNIYTCWAKVLHYLEETEAIVTYIDSICQRYIINVKNNDIQFSIYYGNAPDSDGGFAEFVDDSDEGEWVVMYYEEDFSIICGMSRNPDAVENSDFVVETRAARDPAPQWEPTNDVMVRAADVEVDRQYRCLYTDHDTAVNSAGSAYIIVVGGPREPQLSIYRSDGGAPVSDTDDLIFVPEGDYLLCSSDPSVVWLDATPLVWVKVYDDVSGPLKIINENEDTGGMIRNRLLVTRDMGDRDRTGYTCTSDEKDVREATVRFRVTAGQHALVASLQTTVITIVIAAITSHIYLH